VIFHQNLVDIAIFGTRVQDGSESTGPLWHSDGASHVGTLERGAAETALATASSRLRVALRTIFTSSMFYIFEFAPIRRLEQQFLSTLGKLADKHDLHS
jgi:hypothetical protein